MSHYDVRNQATNALTCAVVLVQEVDLERMAIVHDVFGRGRVVLKLEWLERRVELGLARDDVNGRLPWSVSDGVVLSPFGRTCTRREKNDAFICLELKRACDKIVHSISRAIKKYDDIVFFRTMCKVLSTALHSLHERSL